MNEKVRPDLAKIIFCDAKESQDMESTVWSNRRRFLAMSAAAAAGMMAVPATAAPIEGINVIGPKPGYAPQVGTMVSMLTWMQPAVTSPVAGLTVAQLDYLFNANANSNRLPTVAPGGDRDVLPEFASTPSQCCIDRLRPPGISETSVAWGQPIIGMVASANQGFIMYLGVRGIIPPHYAVTSGHETCQLG